MLLEKTSHLTPETSSKPPIYHQSNHRPPTSNMSSSYQTSSGSLSSSPPYHPRIRSNNFLPNTSNSNYFSSESFTQSKTVESQNCSRSLNGMEMVNHSDYFLALKTLNGYLIFLFKFKNSVLIDSNISNINSEPSYPIEIVHQKPYHHKNLNKNANSSFSSNSQKSIDPKNSNQPLKSSLKPKLVDNLF